MLPWLGLLAGCQGAPPSPAAEPGTPLPGLTVAEVDRFRAGLALFNTVFTPEEGLGPAFNENQCSACHTSPAPGGSAASERITKATRYGGPGRCDLLVASGGVNVRKQATPALEAHGLSRESVPVEATEVGRFITPFLFGLGLVEAIPEAAILAREDPEDSDGDGISGRAARHADGRVLRFGIKGDVATLEDFTRSALLMEMGLTTPGADRDLVQGALPAEGTDPAADPEAPEEVVVLLTTFTRFLAPISPAPARSRTHADTLEAGEELFARLGCVGCHTPEMRTGDHDVSALDDRPVPLFSDLLLHDMGPELASVCGPDASPTEHRTAMLMGLRHREFYLHDGRTMDLRDAVLAHGGEARGAREAFSRLPWLHQEYLLMFLRSL